MNIVVSYGPMCTTAGISQIHWISKKKSYIMLYAYIFQLNTLHTICALAIVHYVSVMQVGQ